MSKNSAPSEDFDGAKIAILRGADVLTLLRDDIPTIPYPNMWDLPGGGREGGETPFETAERELFEELSVNITADKILYQRFDCSALDPTVHVHFFVARWDDLSDQAIILGDEGQCWRWMALQDFITHEKAVPSLKERLAIAKSELKL